MIEQALVPATRERQGDSLCRHHWIIEAQTGPVSRGVCSLCGNVRDFKNYIEEPSSEDDGFPLQYDDWELDL